MSIASRLDLKCVFLSTFCLIILLYDFSFAHGAELIYNGDFESRSPQSPPPGWSMWGANRYKIPANYTRDETNPHGGKYCFRIHHPADTAGYIVTAPHYALRPKKGTEYSISFWARTDKPGVSSFYLEGYYSTHPFVEAPSPGSFLIDVGKDWKRYKFSIYEGWDFFAHRSRYIMLAFKATTNEKEEKTLWIDDVVVTALRSSREGRMTDDTELEHEGLNHRLKQGKELRFTVDPKRQLRRATREAGGVSFHRVAGWTRAPYNMDGQYTLSPELEKAVRDMRLPMTRFYGVGDESFDLKDSIDKVAHVCQSALIPEDYTVLEFETQGATSKIAPEIWAQGVRHSVEKGYNFQHWEVANEPYLMRPGTVFPSTDDYIKHFRAVSSAIRAVQDNAKVGIAINPSSLTWGNYVLKQTAGLYDFVVGHHYVFVPRIHQQKFETVTLTENYKKLESILKLNALIRSYNPNKDVYQFDTEWGLHSSGPDGERADYVDRNANIFGTVHRAVRLIYYTREDILRGASSWEMFSRTRAQGFGILSPDVPSKRYMIYWLYYYFNRHVGESVLDMDGTAPYYTPEEGDPKLAGPMTPALVTLSHDGRTIYLVIANGSWDRSVPCRVSLQNFRCRSAVGTVLSHSDPDGKPLLEEKEDAVAELPVTIGRQSVTCTIPPHSVTFITLGTR